MALTEIGARLRLQGAPAFKRDADRAAGGLDKLARQAGQADRKVSGLERAAKRARSALGSIAKGAAFGAIGAAAAGIGALSVGLIQGFKDAAAMQTMLAKTDAVIKSTGGAAKVSAASVLKMSDQLEALSMIDQEAILNGQNLLLTFTNVRNGVGEANHIFDQATRAMVDMSAAMGSDPQTAAIQLGKALNDPVKGVAALSKVGVQFTKQQKEQIKTLVASGKTMDAQKVILKELNVQFGGAAKAAGSGFEGALFRAKDALGDLFRDVATPLLPGFTKKIEDLSGYLTNTATPAILNFIDGFQNGTGDGGKFRDDLAEVWEAAKDVGASLQTVYEKTKQVIGFIKEHPDEVKTFAVGVAAYATAMKAAATWTAAMAAINLGKLALGIGAVGTASGTAAGGVGALTAAAGAGGAAATAKGVARKAGIGGVVGAVGGYIDSKYIDAQGRYKDTVLPDGRISRFDGKTGKFTIIPAPPKTSKPRPGGSALDRPGVLTPVTKTFPRKGAVGGNLVSAQSVTRTTVVIPVQLNGRQVGQAVIDDFEDRAARR